MISLPWEDVLPGDLITYNVITDLIGLVIDVRSIPRSEILYHCIWFHKNCLILPGIVKSYKQIYVLR